jgi:hypothetical protein
LQAEPLIVVILALTLLSFSRGSASAQVKNPLHVSQMMVRSEYVGQFREFLSLFFPQLKQSWVTLSLSDPDGFSPARRPTRVFFVSASGSEKRL